MGRNVLFPSPPPLQCTQSKHPFIFILLGVTLYIESLQIQQSLCQTPCGLQNSLLELFVVMVPHKATATPAEENQQTKSNLLNQKRRDLLHIRGGWVSVNTFDM